MSTRVSELFPMFCFLSSLLLFRSITDCLMLFNESFAEHYYAILSSGNFFLMAQLPAVYETITNKAQTCVRTQQCSATFPSPASPELPRADSACKLQTSELPPQACHFEI